MYESGKELYSQRLYNLRRAKGMSQDDLGKLLGIQKTAVYKYEKGLTSIPQPKISKLCDIFGVPADYLLGRTNEAPEDFKKYIKIKLYDRWTPEGPEQSKEEFIGYEVSTNEHRHAAEFFAIKTTGESMFPEYLNNDILIVERTKNFESGDDIIVLSGKSNAIVRRVSVEGDGILLKALNPVFGSIFCSNEEMDNGKIIVLGVVRELKRKIK